MFPVISILLHEFEPFEGTAPHIEDLACRMSNITADLFQHFGRLAGIFDKCWFDGKAANDTIPGTVGRREDSGRDFEGDLTPMAIARVCLRR